MANATSVDGASLVVSLMATDPELDPLTVTFTGPLNSSMSSSFPGGFVGVFLLFPIGTSTVTVTVDDGHGGVATRAAQVTVLGSVISDPGTSTVTLAATANSSFTSWSLLHPLYEPTVRVTVENVVSPVVLTLNIRTDNANPPVKPGYQLGSPPYYYDIAATTGANGPFTVCIDITGMSFAAPLGSRGLFHWNGTDWTDTTMLRTATEICGQSPSLGTLAIFHPGNPDNGAIDIAGSGFVPGQIDGPGGDPRDDVIDGGQATASALFQGQGGLAFDAARRLLYTTTNATVRRVDLNTGIMDTYAGDGTVGDFIFDPSDGSFGIGTTDNVDALLASVTNPNQLALDPQGNLFIAQNCRVRRVDRDTHVITTAVGDGFCRHRGDGSLATQASLGGAWAMAFDAAGNLFVADSLADANYIRRVDVATGIITTVAGNGLSSVPVPGPALQTGLPAVTRMAIAPNGDIYMVYLGPMLLRLSGGSLSVINSCALTSCAPQKFRGDNGPVTAAEFVRLLSIAVEANGDVLVGDTADARIRRISAGADGIVTGAADETIVTVVGHNSGDADGNNQVSYRQAEDYGLSSSTGSLWDLLVDPRGGFFYVHHDLVRRVGGPPVASVDADLSVSVRATEGPVLLGGTITYSATIRNHGPSTAAGVSLTVTVPSGLAIVSATSTTATCTPPSAGSFTCDAGSVAAGQQAVIVVTALGNTLGDVTNAFTVSSQQTDPLPINNTAMVSVRVDAGADLSVSIASPAIGATVHVGAPQTFLVTVTNGGSSSAPTTSLGLELPSGLTFVSAAIAGGVCHLTGGEVVCSTDGVAGGTSRQATIIVQPTVAASFSATFAVSSPVLDPNLANNTAIVAFSAIVPPPLEINIVETIVVTDAPGLLPSVMIGVTEQIVVTDAPDVVVEVLDFTLTPATATSATGIPHTVTALTSDASDEDARVVLSTTTSVGPRAQFVHPGVANAPLSVSTTANSLGGVDIIVGLATNAAGVALDHGGTGRRRDQCRSGGQRGLPRPSCGLAALGRASSSPDRFAA